MDSKNITVLVDHDSWILPYAEKLVGQLQDLGHATTLARRVEEVQQGWINFMLGCTRIVREDILTKNEHNLVVHESDLPKGRGFAPIAWQILAGKREISVCLIEAAKEVDSGDIFIRDKISLSGDELCVEWRHLQGTKTIELCMRFMCEFVSLKPMKQLGTPEYFPRRRPSDSELDPDKSIRDQFNLLRIVDNERYPAFFEINGTRYYISINKVLIDQ